MDATWHARPRGSATWTRTPAYVAHRVKRGIYMHYNILYRAPPCIRGQIVNSLNFPGVGLFYFTYLCFDFRTRGASWDVG